MKHGTLSKNQKPQIETPKVTQQLNNIPLHVIPLAEEYIRRVSVFDIKEREINFDEFIDYALSINFEIRNFIDAIRKLRSLEFPNTNVEIKEFSLFHRYENTNIWKHFLEIFLPILIDKRTDTNSLQGEIYQCEVLVYLFDDLIYTISPICTRFLADNLGQVSPYLSMYRLMDKIGTFILHSPKIESGLILDLTKKELVGDKSKLHAQRTLDILETYLCAITFCHGSAAKRMVDEQASVFIEKLSAHKFFQSNSFKLHKKRFNELFKEIPAKIKETASVKVWSYTKISQFYSHWIEDKDNRIKQLIKEINSEIKILPTSKDISQRMLKASSLLLQYKTIDHLFVSTELRAAIGIYLQTLIKHCEQFKGVEYKQLFVVTQEVWVQAEKDELEKQNSIITETHLQSTEESEQLNSDIIQNLSNLSISDKPKNTTTQEELATSRKQLLEDTETQHTAYMQLQEEVLLNEMYSVHQKQLEEELEAQACRHSKELEEFEHSLKIKRTAFEKYLEQKRTLALEQRQKEFEAKIHDRQLNSQAELSKLEVSSDAKLVEKLKTLNEEHAKNCTKVRVNHENQIRNIENTSNLSLNNTKSKLEKERENQLKENIGVIKRVKKSYQEKETALIESHKTETKTVLESRVKELAQIEKEHQDRISALKKEKSDTLDSLKATYKLELEKTQQCVEQELVVAENEFQERITTLQKDHQENKNTILVKQRNQLLKLKANFERTFEAQVNSMARKPYKDYLSTLTQIFEHDEALPFFDYIYFNNKLCNVIPTIPINYQEILRTNSILLNFWRNKISTFTTHYQTISPYQIIGLFLIMPMQAYPLTTDEEFNFCQQYIDEFINFFNSEIPKEEIPSLTNSLKSVMIGFYREYKLFENAWLAKCRQPIPVLVNTNNVFVPHFQNCVNHGYMNNGQMQNRVMPVSNHQHPHTQKQIKYPKYHPNKL